MEEIELEKLRYPIGKFIAPDLYSTEHLTHRIEEIASFPERMNHPEAEPRGIKRNKVNF